jgi:hypothetical protein
MSADPQEQSPTSGAPEILEQMSRDPVSPSAPDWPDSAPCLRVLSPQRGPSSTKLIVDGLRRLVVDVTLWPRVDPSQAGDEYREE